MNKWETIQTKNNDGPDSNQNYSKITFSKDSNHREPFDYLLLVWDRYTHNVTGLNMFVRAYPHLIRVSGATPSHIKAYDQISIYKLCVLYSNNDRLFC